MKIFITTLSLSVAVTVSLACMLADNPGSDTLERESVMLVEPKVSLRSISERGGGTHLWGTRHAAQRVVYLDSEQRTMTLATHEPISGGQIIEEVYKVPYEVECVGGSFNEILVCGWLKSVSGRQLVVETWTLPPVSGAYEGEQVVTPRPTVGDTASISWPSGDWVGSYVPFPMREKRAPVKIKRVLTGGIGSVEGVYIDLWMRYVAIMSKSDGLVYSVDLLGEPALGVIATEQEVPWLDDPNVSPKMVVLFPSTGPMTEVPSGSVCFGFVGYPNDGSQVDLIVAMDSENDGLFESFSSPAPGLDPLGSLTSIYPWESTIDLETIFRN